MIVISAAEAVPRHKCLTENVGFSPKHPQPPLFAHRSSALPSAEGLGLLKVSLKVCRFCVTLTTGCWEEGRVQGWNENIENTHQIFNLLRFHSELE